MNKWENEWMSGRGEIRQWGKDRRCQVLRDGSGRTARCFDLSLGWTRARSRPELGRLRLEEWVWGCSLQKLTKGHYRCCYLLRDNWSKIYTLWLPHNTLNFVFCHVDYQLVQHHSLKSLLPPHWFLKHLSVLRSHAWVFFWGLYGNPLRYSCLENSMDRGAWWATVHGVTKSGHDWATEHYSAPSFQPWVRTTDLMMILINLDVCYGKIVSLLCRTVWPFWTFKFLPSVMTSLSTSWKWSVGILIEMAWTFGINLDRICAFENRIFSSMNV